MTYKPLVNDIIQLFPSFTYANAITRLKPININSPSNILLPLVLVPKEVDSIVCAATGSSRNFLAGRESSKFLVKIPGYVTGMGFVSDYSPLITAFSSSS